ncbi:hypothetical protein [Chitinophaga sp. GbtcB8]|uniref:hypothetical protein n=1 Tax=Chitinophaga sp. GbtcB8 TaxID=2824753 RepID=UPI001C309B0F|nr:hypothetical protein [Chitinophaga sp. GbtcB8]
MYYFYLLNKYNATVSAALLAIGRAFHQSRASVPPCLYGMGQRSGDYFAVANAAQRPRLEPGFQLER